MTGPETNGASDRVSAAEPANGGHAPPMESLKQAIAQFAELREYVDYLVTAYIDRAKSSLRSVLLIAILGVLGMMAAVAMVSTAAALLLVGAAHGIGTLFGDRYWLGDLIVAGIVFGSVGVAAWIGFRMIGGISRKQMVSKYEDRQRKQRVNFGRDVRNWAGKSGN